jgi:prenyltransferase beta subunit
MNKRITSLLTILMMVISCSVANAQSPAIANGLSYLTSNQNPDGSWGNDLTNTEHLPSTVSVIETLQVLNQTGTSNYINAVAWLQSQGLDLSDYLSERIHALSVAGTDQDLLISYLDDMTGAWSGDDSPDVDNLDTLLALSALKKINYADQNTIDYALNYLISAQNADGGWGLQQGMDSEVYYAALVSSTLQQFQRTTSIATAINKATAYLVSHQNTDGGFGSSTSTVYETSLSYLALIGATTNATALTNAISYLTSTQLPNGSWEDDPYSTALALRALANVKPNLSITSTDFIFSNPTPTVGETITITATIYNIGPAQADNISVQFYDGDPSSGGVLIEETTIETIPAFGSSQTSINYTISTASSKTIFVKIDPMNIIDELICSKNDYKKLSKLLQKNHSFYDRFLFSFMVKHSMTCSRCSHSDKVMYYGRFQVIDPY